LRRAGGPLVVLLVLADVLRAQGPPPAPSPKPSAPPATFRERLRYPLGRPRALGRGYLDGPLLRFEETIEVQAPPLDFERLRADWTRHWNLARNPKTQSGTPSHSDMRETWRDLERLSGVPVRQGAPLLPLAVAATQAIAKKLAKKSMPPAPPPPAPTPTPVPLRVFSDEEPEAEPTGSSTPPVRPPAPPTLAAPNSIRSAPDQPNLRPNLK
jgi:hypothetical protein